MASVIEYIKSGLEEATKVVKKQKSCETKVSQALDQLMQLVSAAIEKLEADKAQDCSAVAAQLAKDVDASGVFKEMNAQTKDLHSSISKLNKAVDKAFDPDVDICKAMRDVQFDQAAMNQVIAEHLYRDGRFSLGDVFCDEAGIMDSDSLKQPYVAMHEVLEKLKAHELHPALEWAVQHRDRLAQDGGPSSFEFKLHSLNFLHVMQTEGQAAALSYAKQHFPTFQKKHMKEIQRLMGCLLYAGRPLSESPYADLLSPSLWQEIAAEFKKQACSLLGQAYDSPLAVTVAAGSVALPALLKLASVMEKNLQDDLKTCAQLPFEIELGPEFVFHSIFACPVSREQSSKDNPPLLLPCNHVLCQQSVLSIAKTRNRMFKCPYCPQEAKFDQLKPIVFPDAL